VRSFPEAFIGGTYAQFSVFVLYRFRFFSLEDSLMLSATQAQIAQSARITHPQSTKVETYGVLGRWCTSPLSILRRPAVRDLSYWLASQGPFAGKSQKQHLLKVYRALHPEYFFSCRGLRLFDETLGLRGEMAFTCQSNPHFIPDNPPEEIVRRYTNAIIQIPQATFWFLEPVAGRQDDGVMRFLTLEQVRHEQAKNLRECFAWAEKHGRKVRAALCAKRGAQQAGRLTLTCTLAMAMPAIWLARGALGIGKVAVDAGLESLRDVSDTVGRLQDERQLRARARKLGFDSATEYLRSIDPILSYTLPKNPNLHRMLGHWFHQTMDDGSVETLVHL
jgi:hypothetical protein